MTRSLAEDLLARAMNALPCEAAGLIFGRDGLAEKFVELDNISISANPRYPAFEFSRSEFEKALEDATEPLVAFFHSHPTDIPAPSTLDINGARDWPRTPHLILSLQGAGPSRFPLPAFRFPLPASGAAGPALRCWRIFDGQAMPEEIEYVEARL